MPSPNVSWAQRSDSIWLTVEVSSPADLKVDIAENKLNLSCTDKGTAYALELSFFKPIVVEQSKYSQHRMIDFFLKKKDTEDWPRLLETTQKFPWLKVDWSKWVCDEDEEAEKGGFDYSGMGDMGDLSRFNQEAPEGEADSDDDDLPDLDEPVEESSSTQGKQVEEEVTPKSEGGEEVAA